MKQFLIQIGTQQNAAEFACAEDGKSFVRKFESHVWKSLFPTQPAPSTAERLINVAAACSPDQRWFPLTLNRYRQWYTPRMATKQKSKKKSGEQPANKMAKNSKLKGASAKKA